MIDRRLRATLVWFALVLLQCAGEVDAAAVVDRVVQIRQRGVLNCGVWPEVRGFAAMASGTYTGFDIDICRAIAAAALADATRVQFIPLAHFQQFARHPEVDVVVRRLTGTRARENQMHVRFAPTIFYDGQGLMIPRGRLIAEPMDLAGQPICVLNAERFAATLRNYFRERERDIELVLVADDAEAERALDHGRCVAYSADLSWLAAARADFSDGVSHYVLLPQTISREPLAPMLRAEDVGLLRLVRWTIFALIKAEELGLNSHNIAGGTGAGEPEQAFLALHPDLHVSAGPDSWAATLIGAVGNYAEIFDRNLGDGSSIKLDRGLNHLRKDGGLIDAVPPKH